MQTELEKAKKLLIGLFDENEMYSRKAHIIQKYEENGLYTFFQKSEMHTHIIAKRAFKNAILNDLWEVHRHNIFPELSYFDRCTDFNGGFSIVSKNNKCTYLGYTGELLTEGLIFDHCSDFMNGFAVVTKKGKKAYINKNGIIITDFVYEQALPFIDGKTAEVQLNGKWMKINRLGKIIKNK